MRRFRRLRLMLVPLLVVAALVLSLEAFVPKPYLVVPAGLGTERDAEVHVWRGQTEPSPGARERRAPARPDTASLGPTEHRVAPARPEGRPPPRRTPEQPGAGPQASPPPAGAAPPPRAPVPGASPSDGSAAPPATPPAASPAPTAQPAPTPSPPPAALPDSPGPPVTSTGDSPAAAKPAKPGWGCGDGNHAHGGPPGKSSEPPC